MDYCDFMFYNIFLNRLHNASLDVQKLIKSNAKIC